MAEHIDHLKNIIEQLKNEKNVPTLRAREQITEAQRMYKEVKTQIAGLVPPAPLP